MSNTNKTIDDSSVASQLPHVCAINGLVTECKMAYPGMPVREALNECVALNVPGIPFCDKEQNISGRISVKHILASRCVPADVRKHAHLLGDYLEHLEISAVKVRDLVNEPVDRFVIPNIPFIASNSPIVKALALIEQFESSYIFVVDDGAYKGTVTLINLANYFLRRASHPA